MSRPRNATTAANAGITESDYDVMITGMSWEEAEAAAHDEGLQIGAVAKLQDMKAALRAHFCPRHLENMPPALARPRNATLAEAAGLTESDYAMMIAGMSWEDARAAADDEGLQIEAAAPLEELKSGLRAHFCPSLATRQSLRPRNATLAEAAGLTETDYFTMIAGMSADEVRAAADDEGLQIGAAATVEDTKNILRDHFCPNLHYELTNTSPELMSEADLVFDALDSGRNASVRYDASMQVTACTCGHAPRAFVTVCAAWLILLRPVTAWHLRVGLSWDQLDHKVRRAAFPFSWKARSVTCCAGFITNLWVLLTATDSFYPGSNQQQRSHWGWRKYPMKCSKNRRSIP
jgi:hypothetical protein